MATQRWEVNPRRCDNGGTMLQSKGRARARTWTSTSATKEKVLDAAVEVFGEHGFTAATMAEIVERSGVSVGSIYHHFGGKTEVFNAIWEDFVGLLRSRVDEVVQAARQGGETDGFELFVVGTREYLWLIWENRAQARVVAMGDTPPGFDVQRRRASRVGGTVKSRCSGSVRRDGSGCSAISCSPCATRPRSRCSARRPRRTRKS